jgi:hypothetical protein
MIFIAFVLILILGVAAHIATNVNYIAKVVRKQVDGP